MLGTLPTTCPYVSPETRSQSPDNSAFRRLTNGLPEPKSDSLEPFVGSVSLSEFIQRPKPLYESKTGLSVNDRLR